MVAGGGRRLRIVVTDPIIERFATHLLDGAPEHDWNFLTDPHDPRLPEAIAGCDVLVCSRLSGEAAADCGAELVQVTGAGLDRIAVDALPAGTLLANTFHHARPIAEHVMMSVLALERRLLPTDAALRRGQWSNLANDAAVPPHRSFDSLTVGSIGLGGIGTETLRLASAWGADTVAIRSDPTAALPGGIAPRWVRGPGALPRLLEESDVVVVTVPLSDATRGMIGARELAAMRPDALLVNVSRGPVVDQHALFDALREPPTSGQGIGGAALDVWWGAPEPRRTPPADVDFTTLQNVILTPHNSGHATATFVGRAADIAANIEAISHGTTPINLVRRHSRSPIVST
ncbi:2-hydroxyacid dehydrogenase [Arthrobacter sp.]|uniref:2-hydroxyacid dehydrogenase n=1 Tax=Arthrobacter sp. TaxID=1667 RepID=UPI003A94B5BB